MSGRPAVKSPFENLRPTIVREPSRTAISAEAEARLLDKPEQPFIAVAEKSVNPDPKTAQTSAAEEPTFVPDVSPFVQASLLKKKRRDRLLLVSFRMPQTLKERLEDAAKKHEVNQTDIINEAIELNLQRYL